MSSLPLCELLARFFENISCEPSGCWHWNGGTNGAGYGWIHRELTHRISYVIHYGRIPDGMLVCHTCDNRRCVNPDHLFVGTYTDNVRDMVKKQRWKPPPWNKRDKHQNAKLSYAQVDEIVSKYHDPARTCTIKELADSYGVSKSLVYQLVWKAAKKSGDAA